jgi:hypothetical protein
MKVQRDYHDKTPDLADRLAKDIAAALRLDLLFTVTSVPCVKPVMSDLGDVKVRYYFEASFPEPNLHALAADENKRAGVAS